MVIRPALIVVDFQEDFCPPVGNRSRITSPRRRHKADVELQNGSLAVPEGRDIAPVVNQLLSLPFVTKIATKDWHPASHVSFAANYANKQPFTDYATVVNPANPDERYETRLWPVHCVQGTPGAELVPELEAGKIDEGAVVEKGQDPRVEMYSPFYDKFEHPRGCDSGLAKRLRDAQITDVYVVGLAADYCVRSCAEDAAKEGFRSFIVEEGTRPVDKDNWTQCRAELEKQGVKVVTMQSNEVQRLMTAF
ncbi:pyrazinamidase nicotinamidase protein [Apiospora aurea]|uniref:nicotinamidase n=1 Tax=Apiospora aurea TaxID=335848 RepID=A0ABR1QYY9_9PEZI